MGLFSDDDEVLDLIILDEMRKKSKSSGGCMLSLLAMLMPVVIAVCAIL